METELPPYVQPGSLGGVDVDDASTEVGSSTTTSNSEAEKLEVPSEIDPGAEGGDNEQDDPGEDIDQKPEKKPSGTPSRIYLVFEERIDGDAKWYLLQTEVEARNAEQALRRGYKKLQADSPARLVVVPINYWNAATIETKQRPSIAIRVD